MVQNLSDLNSAEVNKDELRLKVRFCLVTVHRRARVIYCEDEREREACLQIRTLNRTRRVDGRGGILGSEAMIATRHLLPRCVRDALGVFEHKHLQKART